MIFLTSRFRRHLGLIKWLVPFVLVVVVIAYELGPSRWIYQSLGFDYHLAVEIILFGTVGPLLAFLLLDLLNRWIEEKETADLQATLLAQAKEKDLEVRQLNDDTLQALFAISMLMAAIKSDGDKIAPQTIAQIEDTEKTLHESIRHIRVRLLS